MTIVTHTTVVAAPPGAGKSETGKVLKNITGGDPHFLIADTSEVIKWHRERETDIGKQFSELIPLQRRGKLLPADLIVDATIQYLAHHDAQTTVYHFFWLGGVRDPMQGILVKEKFQHVKLVHLRCSLDEAIRGIADRAGIETREDGDDPDVVRDRYADYERFTVPAIIQFKHREPRKSVLELEKQERMSKKTIAILEFVDVREGVRSAWLHRCRDRSHSAYQHIASLDEASRRRMEKTPILDSRPERSRRRNVQSIQSMQERVPQTASP